MAMTGMPVVAETSSTAAKFFRIRHGYGDAPVDDGKRQKLVASAQIVGNHADDFFVDLVFVEVHERQAHALRQRHGILAFGLFVHAFGGRWHGGKISGDVACRCRMAWCARREHLMDLAGRRRDRIHTLRESVRRVAVFVSPEEGETASRTGVAHNDLLHRMRAYAPVIRHNMKPQANGSICGVADVQLFEVM